MSYQEYNEDLFNNAMKRDYYVFYDGKFVGNLTPEYILNLYKQGDGRLFQQSFIYEPKALGQYKWWRADRTPRANDDVPPEYLAMVLLLV